MAVDYFDFRTKDWGSRIKVFNTISAEERADLVRAHVRWWLEAHRATLSAEQISILEESIKAIVPELYIVSQSLDVAARRTGRLGDPTAVARLEPLMERAKAVFTPDQMRQALTMHWKPGEFATE
jgi:hypothetical protein